MKKLHSLPILILALLMSCTASSDELKTENIVSHNNITVVTNPKKGTNPYPQWTVFPDKDKKIRRIVMNVTLGTPDSLPTAHWDYCDHINILRVGGVNGESKGYEMGRMLTPYGSIYSEGWKFKWSADVSDFADILRDSVEIEYMHSGYEPTTVGWSLTIDFDITYGEPHIEQLGMDKLWYGNFVYGDSTKPFEEQVKPYEFTMPEGAEIARMRLQHTGHGMDRTRGCSEFCSRWRRIYLDDKIVQEKDLWKNCGDNPLYPQGGTWIFDRALWCPGDLQEPDIINTYPSQGAKHSIKMEMEPYQTENVKQPKENIRSMIFYFSAPKNKNDVLLEEILKPNKDPFYNRLNPAIRNPKIKIRNLGSSPLTSLTIKYYFLANGQQYSENEYQWTGNLAYYESEIIDLPGIIDAERNKQNAFEVECIQPNGQADAWKGDNKKVVDFDPPMEMPNKFVIQYKTNATPEENFIELRDENDNVIYSKMPQDVKPNTIYNDTVTMPNGVTGGELTLIDTAGQGLEFWYLVKQGYGFLRVLDTSGRMIHEFEKDCGDGEKLAFSVSNSFDINKLKPQYSFTVFPKRVKDKFIVNVHSDTPDSEMEVRFLQFGKTIKSYKYPKIDKDEYEYNIDDIGDGRYIVEIFVDGERKFKTRINKSKE
ncbi:MAG: peptide-N-glycosidase F-related protein [Bacteroidales bacterium]